MADGQTEMEWPDVVTEKEWQAELAELTKAETAVTGALRDLAARRRRMPVTEVGSYEFDGPQAARGRGGLASLLAADPALRVVAPARRVPGRTDDDERSMTTLTTMRILLEKFAPRAQDRCVGQLTIRLVASH